MRVLVGFVVCICSIICGCAVSGTVVDRSEHSAELEKMKLRNPDMKVFCGGTRRELPLKVVKTCKIDAAVTTSVDGELYLGVELELIDGTRLGVSQKGNCYISADNELIGKSEHGTYSATFDNINSFTIRE
ncbi:MAG: hypothetical protein ACLFTW_03090 [Chitinispirillaceae bacterium]